MAIIRRTLARWLRWARGFCLWMKRQLRQNVWGAGAIALVMLFNTTGVGQMAQLNYLDWLLRHRPEETLDPRIVIVKIDEAYYQELREQQNDRSYFEYRALAELTQKILQQSPAVVALDVPATSLSGGGQAELAALFLRYPHLLSVEKAFPPTIEPIADVAAAAPEQIAFNDVPSDLDGKIRRMFIGSFREEGGFSKSLSFRIAELYLLRQHGIQSSNGVRDPKTARFGRLELPRLNPFQDLYSGWLASPNQTPLDGIQTLIHFRQQPEPFTSISAQAVVEGSAAALAQLGGKIVLVGVSDPSRASILNTAVPRHKLFETPSFQSEVLGVELQAHATSQIIQAVLGDRRLLRSVHHGYSYGFILGFGWLGCWIGRASDSVFVGMASLGFAVGFSLLLAYVLLLWQGLYFFPHLCLAALAVTGVGYTLARQRRIAQREVARRKAAQQQTRDREIELEARTRAIEDSFGEIHSGPLQILALLLRQMQDGTLSMAEIETRLIELNRRIRIIGEHLRQEARTGQRQTLLRSLQHADLYIDLSRPLHESFYDIYYQTLEKPWPTFQQLRIKSRSFERLVDQHLTNDDRAALCKVLEEAILNVGKHAEGATRLTVTGRHEEDFYVLCVEDNGPGLLNNRQGGGSQLANALAQRLSGHFSREQKASGGVRFCFRWPLRSPQSPKRNH